MYLRVETTALAALLVLALCQDLRVSSFALLPDNPPAEYVFPGDYGNNKNSLGYFSDGGDNYTSTTDPEDGSHIPLVGGQRAKIGQFPWMAVVHRLVGEGRISLCGGTIISVRWILTAGHCVAEYPRRFLIVLGDVDKRGIGYDFYNGPGDSMITTQGALHPQYSQQVNDIALLWMPRDINFKHVIQPIRLAGMNEASQSFAGQLGTVVGWGRESPTQNGGSQDLKYLGLPVISNNECATAWGISESHVCTGTGSREDACQGDSGGPLVVQVNNEYLQIGVVSYGDKQCSSSLPGVFTRVSSFAGWIRQVTGISY